MATWKTWRSSVVLSLTMTTAACGKADVSLPAPSLTTRPVVYGEDGRVDWYAIEDAELKQQARDSVAAMIPWGYLSSDETGAVAVYGEPTLGESYGLCADQRFRDQPTAAVCSGTLIAPDLVLTAGHCVPDLSSCVGSAWVFDYLYEADGARANVTEDAVYRCVDVIVRPGVDLDDDLDLSVLQLDRPVLDRAPAAMASQSSLLQGARLVLAGFPNGIPLKVDDSGVVAAPRSAQANYFIASVDAFSGNSGSGVLDMHHEVIGVLVSGADDYANAGSCTVVSTLDPDEAEESVMYAYHAREAVCARGYPSPLLCPDGEVAFCGDGFCTDGEAGRCDDDCGALFAVPEGWTCDADWYDADDDCDCDCGVRDPDCDDARLDVVNCAPGSACNPDGTCVSPIPATWVCQRFQYGDGDRCNCDCGAPDPDCKDPDLEERGCAPGGVCQSDGTCTISLPDGWECQRRFYGSGDGCDCECGARDPDCDDPAQEVYGCTPGTACGADGACEVPLPQAWVCGWSTYAAGDECDCNCGLYDPDCDTARVTRNCGDGQVCNAEGRCEAEQVVEPEPEPEATPEVAPEAGPEEVDAEEDDTPEAIAEATAEPEPDRDDGDDARDDDDADPRDGGDGEVADGIGGIGGEGTKGAVSGGCAAGGGDAGALSVGLALGALGLARAHTRRTRAARAA